MDEVVLSRDVPAIAIPYGETIILPAGTTVTIGRKLGGSYTVTWSEGMAQIRRENADALGVLPEEADPAKAASSHAGPPDIEEIWDALRGVYDPEIPVNIVDLGLVYSVEITNLNDEKFGVDAAMTLTAPGCAMGPAIAQDAQARLEQVPGVSVAEVRIVWEPPWNQNMISEKGKMELGLI
ncbi:MAG TPA: iron-sulfur cluster assembly protein [Opitutales bacterium]|nr:iron-sulfur cluster assembly protein [Opitutales bacterium]